jgi:hypothetical protein
MRSSTGEWRCSEHELAGIIAELRPMIDRLVARSNHQLLRWAREHELAEQRIA